MVFINFETLKSFDATYSVYADFYGNSVKIAHGTIYTNKDTKQACKIIKRMFPLKRVKFSYNWQPIQRKINITAIASATTVGVVSLIIIGLILW